MVNVHSNACLGGLLNQVKMQRPVFCNQIQIILACQYCSTKQQMRTAEILQQNILNVNSATDVSLSSPQSCARVLDWEYECGKSCFS